MRKKTSNSVRQLNNINLIITDIAKMSTKETQQICFMRE